MCQLKLTDTVRATGLPGRYTRDVPFAGRRRPDRLQPARLIVIDDVDQGGPAAAAMLSVVAARRTASATAMIVTTTAPLGLRGELRLAGLSQADLAEAARIADDETAHALWVASRGLPGVALPLTGELTGAQDPVVHLALRAAPAAAFLDLDPSLIRLLEIAAERARDDATRSRILARLARELLGDASAGNDGERWPTRR
jgi:hypothetical protein